MDGVTKLTTYAVQHHMNEGREVLLLVPQLQLYGYSESDFIPRPTKDTPRSRRGKITLVPVPSLPLVQEETRLPIPGLWVRTSFLTIARPCVCVCVCLCVCVCVCSLRHFSSAWDRGHTIERARASLVTCKERDGYLTLFAWLKIKGLSPTSSSQALPPTHHHPHHHAPTQYQSGNPLAARSQIVCHQRCLAIFPILCSCT